MSPFPNRPATAAWVEREAFIEAFEAARESDPDADLARFLPAREHPFYLHVLEELVRIDLEHHWLRGEPRWLEGYVERFPELIEASAVVRTLAFEEFRLRRKAGHAPRADEYLARFGIDPTRAIRDDLPETLVPGPRTPKPMAARIAHVMATLPRVGDNFLGYELVAELGAGAFGQVFLARSEGECRSWVALKVVQDFGGEDTFLTRLRHLNVMPVEAIHHAGPFRAIQMPYRGAVTLAHVLARLKGRRDEPDSGRAIVEVSRPGLPTASVAWTGAAVRAALCRATYADTALWVIARLADGLAHAHGRGVLHRDIKPANVLLADDGRPMLLDFNLAADTAGDAPPGGTLPYMAPEILEAFRDGGRSLDPRTDLFSLGVILFQLLTGQLPYPTRDSTAEGVTEALADRRIAAPGVRLVKPGAPRHAADVVGRLLERDPARRYDSAAALRNDLDAHLPNLPRSATNPD